MATDVPGNVKLPPLGGLCTRAAYVSVDVTATNLFKRSYVFPTVNGVEATELPSFELNLSVSSYRLKSTPSFFATASKSLYVLRSQESTRISQRLEFVGLQKTRKPKFQTWSMDHGPWTRREKKTLASFQLWREDLDFNVYIFTLSRNTCVYAFEINGWPERSLQGYGWNAGGNFKPKLYVARKLLYMTMSPIKE
jgi:hypothetical protein